MHVKWFRTRYTTHGQQYMTRYNTFHVVVEYSTASNPITLAHLILRSRIQETYDKLFEYAYFLIYTTLSDQSKLSQKLGSSRDTRMHNHSIPIVAPTFSSRLQKSCGIYIHYRRGRKAPEYAPQGKTRGCWLWKCNFPAPPPRYPIITSGYS